MPDLPALIDAIREDPNDAPRRLALASWLWDNHRDDQSAAVRVYWPTLGENVLVSGVSLNTTLRQLARHAKLLGQRARKFEERRDESAG